MALGRQIASCLALLAAGVLLFGCGSSSSNNANIPPEAATAFNAKLDQIQERFAAGHCTGLNSAASSLQSLQAAVEGGLLSGVDQQFITDLNDQLSQLGTQIDQQCVPADTTTSTTTKSTTPTTTTTSTTTPTTTTTKSTTSTTTKSTTPTTPTPPTPPPPTGGGNGNNPGGGISPGGKKEQAR